MAKTCLACGLVAFSLFQAVLAQSPVTTEVLGLQAAYQAALVHDPSYKAAQAKWLAAQEQLPIARARLLPQVAISSSRLRVEQDRKDGNAPEQNQRYPSSSDTLNLRQPLFQARAWLDTNQAAAMVEAAQAQWQAEQQALLVRLVNAYFTLLLEEERTLVLKRQLESADSKLRGAERAFSAGTGIRTDVDELIAQRDLLLAERLKASQARLVAQAELASIVGQEPAQLGRLAGLNETGLSLKDFDPGGLDLWLERARTVSPAMLQAQAQVQALQASARAATADRLPTLDLLLQASRSEGENAFFVTSRTRSQTYGIQLNVPLFQGGGEFARQRQAAAALAEGEANQTRARALVTNNVRRFYFAVKEGVARVEALDKALSSALQVVVANQRSFQAGLRSTLDIVAAEQRASELLLERESARLQTISAWVQLRAEVGEDQETAVQQIAAFLVNVVDKK